DKAPYEIRQAGWNFELYDIRTGIDLHDIKIHDYGDLDVKDLTPTMMIDHVRSFTKDKILKHGKFPVVLGGEHSVTTGVVKALPKSTVLLSLDAHLDFREQYENDKNNHACVIRRISEHLPMDNIAVIGIRSAEREEYKEAVEKNLFIIDAYRIHDIGVKKTIDKIKDHLKEHPLYITLDIDVIDPAYAPGTSTPEPYGLTPLQVLEILEAFSPNLVGFDVVEVCPAYDHGETALLAARLIRSVIGKVWGARYT
ncbi:MAG: agmatinase, partial [Candidatus Thermoplasmatota archaeon]